MEMAPASRVIPGYDRSVACDAPAEGAEAERDEIVSVAENLYEGDPIGSVSFWEGRQRLLFPKNAVVYRSRTATCFPMTETAAPWPESDGVEDKTRFVSG
ncbi:hypothetical protein HII36_02330 [Nonomuraea sp. NN258]|uniref:hypothetical protein n=1 Tax=Nonomuraea antri TaxID=2730852 RepID=UPI0015698ABF|nr:hypothetical protein [Nonomuraea antri]NRQ30677.1 hypothetical protein [Nonomuraea antri]